MMQMTFDQVKSDMARRKTHRDDLLRGFEQEGQLTTAQVFYLAGTGASSRIKELKRKGHRIVATYVRPGEWVYSYLGNKNDEDQTSVLVID